jgi:endoglycosylceramidase
VRLRCLLALACSACQAPPAGDPSPSLRVAVDGRALRDAAGRELLLRGINCGGRSKLSPFLPFEFRESGLPAQAAAPVFAEALARYVERVRGWGLNVVRLPWIWEALEPERGSIDELYLERYLATARAFSRRGIRVVVDFHQDVFARPYCGDGFPLWACPQPAPETPKDCTQWYSGYLSSPAVRAAFDRFWRNEDGVQDAFVAAWQRVAAAAWRIDGVIGFDLINEPFNGSAPAATWYRETLRPFYARLASALHAVAPGALLLVEPTALDGPAAETKLELPAAAGLVLAPHYYNPLVFLYREWTGSMDLAQPIGSWAGYGAAFGVPVFVGEFGVARSVKGGGEYLRALYAALDRFALHGTQWEISESALDWNDEGYNVLEADGRERPSVASLLRAYPRAVAGKLASFAFDPATRSGELEFAATAGGVTEVAAPARLYPDGATATIEGVPGSATWDAAREVIVVEIWSAGNARLRFRPRAP